MRNKFSAAPPDVQSEQDINRSQGTARAISTFIDPSLSWKDVAWLKSITSLPLVLKGVQCAEDAILAVS
jgi:L-lactate dehydrogenase (cytochrome)